MLAQPAQDGGEESVGVVHLRQGREREAGGVGDLSRFTDPVPQALVLTAIVIGFAMTALFLVVLLASRGFTGTDHVDGREQRHD